MSYLRGETYIYSGDGGAERDGEEVDCVQIWREADLPYMPENYRSGVALPEDTADIFVLMRVAQLLLSGDFEHKIDEAALIDNFGAKALRQNKERIKSAFVALAREMRTKAE